MLENAAPPSWKFSSPIKNSSMERSSHLTPSPQPPPQQRKENPENVFTLPNDHYYM